MAYIPEVPGSLELDRNSETLGYTRFSVGGFGEGEVEVSDAVFCPQLINHFYQEIGKRKKIYVVSGQTCRDADG